MATEVDPVGENDPVARQGSPQKEGTSNSIKGVDARACRRWGRVSQY